MIRKATKKPVTIEFMLLEQSTDSQEDIAKWCGGYKGADGGVKIKTLEGVMTANTGDYIIKGIKGEFYPCKPDIFLATYDINDQPGVEVMELPDERPVLAKIEYQGDLGKSTWNEVVYYVHGRYAGWFSFKGSETFDDGEQVVAWSYVDDIELTNK